MPKASKRTAIAILLITIAGVAAVVSLAWWYSQQEPEGGFRLYSNFNFSFEYPKDMEISEQGLVAGTNATTDSGILTGELSNGAFELIKVGWFTTESAPDLETSLNNSLVSLEVEGWLTVEKGQLKDSATVNGHEMLYQSFTATTGEADTFQGISGVWYCETSNRSFDFILMFLQDNQDIQEILQKFQQYTVSFTCT
jgi:hypothetical protein